MSLKQNMESKIANSQHSLKIYEKDPKDINTEKCI